MFITFEGLDFCGKSTQVSLLKNYLESRKKVVRIIREPGGTNISEFIRDILLDKNNNEMCSETELLLFSSSRAQLIREVIVPSLKRGEYVISDRFHDSTTAYQGFGRGLSIDFIKQLNNFVLSNTLPDITFFIDLSLEDIALRKQNKKNLSLDRIEVSNSDFYKKVREGYLELAKSEKRFCLIEGNKTPEEIHKIIVEKVEELENA